MRMRIELKDIIGFVTFAAIGTTMWPYLLGFIQGNPIGRNGNNNALEKVSVAGVIIGCVVYTVFILTRGEKKVD